jgi:hypothetical protein
LLAQVCSRRSERNVYSVFRKFYIRSLWQCRLRGREQCDRSWHGVCFVLWGRVRRQPANCNSQQQETQIMVRPSFQMSSLCAAAAVLAAACASTPVPQEKIAVAQASLQRAERAGAAELAGAQFAAAQDKLSRAQKAAADHDAQPAEMLADQANVDAQLAEASATEQRSHKAATEFDASLQALRQESQRATPLPPSAQPATAQPGFATGATSQSTTNQ